MPGRDEEYLNRLAEQEAFKSLCRSLVVRALRDFVTYRTAKKPGERRLFAEAQEWIFDGHVINQARPADSIEIADQTKKDLEELDRLMSFESICGILGWDVDLVRKRASLLKKEDLDRIGPNLMDL